MTTAGNAMSVLLVDDEAEFASTLAERLRLRGYEANAVFDGESALKLLEQNKTRENFDVVLLDMLLPGIHGTELLDRIRELCPGLPVVLLTGQAGSQEGVECLSHGVRACLAKPLVLGELLSLFRKLQQEKANA